MTESANLLEQGKRSLAELKYAEAEDSFQAAARLDPDSAEPHIWLGRARLMQEKLDEGGRALDRALQLNPQSAEAFALKGVAEIQKKQYSAAIDFLERAMKIDPSLDMAYFNLAKSYRETGNTDQAEIVARDGLKQNKRNFQLHSELSHVLALKGRIKDAIDEMLEAIKINPLYLKGYLVLGSIYRQAGKTDVVLRLYREGLRHNSDALPLREEICNLLALQGDFTRAYEEAQDLLNRRGNYSDFLRAGTYAAALKHFAQAESHFRKAIEINHDAWEAHYNLGEILMQLNRPAEAKAEYEAALKYGENQYKPLNAMGLYLLQQEKKPEDARKLFERAFQIAPDRPEVLFNLALSNGVLKDYESAEKYAEQCAQSLRPGQPLQKEAERLLRVIRQEKAHAKQSG